MLFAAVGASAQQPSPRLVRALSAPTSVHWRGAAARDALARLARETSIEVWLDRRIDAGRPMRLDLVDEPLAVVLDHAASELDASAVALDRIVYLGPTEAAAQLEGLAARWRVGAPAGLRRRETVRWPRLTRPRDLAVETAEAAGCRLANPERLPHDLWPAGATPPLALGDRLTLIGLGFGQSWTLDAPGRDVVRFVPLSAGAAAEPPPPLAELVKDSPTPAGPTRYTLRVVDQPLGPVVRQLARQLGREFRSELAAEGLERRVTFSVRQATLGELLAAITAAAGAPVTDKGGAITVGP